MLRIETLRRKKFLLDTGPFLYLLLAEYADNTNKQVYSKKEKIGDQNFSKEKAEAYWSFLARREVYITSHVLTETSNHLESGKYNFNLNDVLEETTSLIREQVKEKHVDKDIIFKSDSDLSVGVTDLGLQKLADRTDKELVLVYQDGDLSYTSESLSFEPVSLGILLTKVRERHPQI